MEFPGGLVVKELALSLLWLSFNSWPEDAWMLQAVPKKKKGEHPPPQHLDVENSGPEQKVHNCYHLHFLDPEGV